MRALLFALLVYSSVACANPALHGTWSTAVNGQPLVVTFEAGGKGTANGTPMQWQALGQLLFFQQQGGQVITYSFEVKGDELRVAGGDLGGVVAFSRGTAAADAARAKLAAAKAAAPAKAGAQVSAAASGDGQELVGKWCKITGFSANRGGSQSSQCFELRPDGTYLYRGESSSSGAYGGTASQSSDAGRWKVSGNQLTAQSQRGTVNTYTLEKRNHPKNRGDPMICLNGECYVTFYNRPAWQ
jgi:hypothetical protein